MITPLHSTCLLRGTSFLLPTPYPLLAKACQDPSHKPSGEDAGSLKSADDPDDFDKTCIGVHKTK